MRPHLDLLRKAEFSGNILKNVMPKFGLEIKAYLEGLSSIGRDRDATLRFGAQCTHCKEQVDVEIDCGELQALPDSRGDAHYLCKCKLCKRSCWIKVLEEPGVYLEEVNDSWVGFGVFECRGMELVSFDANHGEFVGNNEETGHCEAFELCEGEYYGVDEVSSESVSVTDFDSRIVKL